MYEICKHFQYCIVCMWYVTAQNLLNIICVYYIWNRLEGDWMVLHMYITKWTKGKCFHKLLLYWKHWFTMAKMVVYVEKHFHQNYTVSLQFAHRKYSKVNSNLAHKLVEKVTIWFLSDNVENVMWMLLLYSVWKWYIM